MPYHYFPKATLIEKMLILAEVVNVIKSVILPIMDVKNQITLMGLLFKITHLFKDVDSEFKLINTLKSLNLLSEVKEVVFSKELSPSHDHGEICLKNSIKKV